MTPDEQDPAARPRDEAGEPDAAIVASDTAATAPDEQPETPAAIALEISPSAELDELRRERDDLRQALLRRRAEFENFRRRTDRERQTWVAEAEAALAKELVPALDNLEQALKTDSSEGGLHEGVELIQRELLATLGRLGLVVHDPVGQPFNPLTDQALLHEEVPGTAEGVVIETFRKGYCFKDRLLRPAMVKVAKAPSDPAQSDGGDAASGTAANAVH
jgi:molecular chaperone GrpE